MKRLPGQFSGVERRGVWAALASGCIFMARGAFLPYFFVFYQKSTNFSYTEIAFLLNAFVISQATIPIIFGGLIDRSRKIVSAVTLFASYSIVFLVILLSDSVPVLMIAFVILGGAFSVSRLLFNKQIVGTVDHGGMRRTISVRAILMTSGSLCGNALGAFFLTQFGIIAFISFIFLSFGAAAMVFGIVTARDIPEPRAESQKETKILKALLDPVFLRDLLRLVPPLLIYGCWGTILPKYIIDSTNDIGVIPVMYAATTATVLTLTWFFNSCIFELLNRRKVEFDVYPIVATFFFSVGVLILSIADGLPFVILGGVVFIIGEIVIIPYLDETARRHGGSQAGVYIGIILVAEGACRSVGMLVGSILYGTLNGSDDRVWTFPIVVGVSVLITVFMKLVFEPAIKHRKAHVKK